MFHQSQLPMIIQNLLLDLMTGKHISICRDNSLDKNWKQSARQGLIRCALQAIMSIL